MQHLIFCYSSNCAKFRWRRWRSSRANWPAGTARPRGPGRSRRARRGHLGGLGSQNWQILHFFTKLCKFLAGSFSAVSKRNFARKYAFDSIFKLYKICILLHRCNLKFFAKNRFEKSACEIQQKFCKCRKICKICQISKISAC